MRYRYRDLFDEFGNLRPEVDTWSTWDGLLIIAMAIILVLLLAAIGMRVI